MMNKAGPKAGSAQFSTRLMRRIIPDLSGAHCYSKAMSRKASSRPAAHVSDVGGNLLNRLRSAARFQQQLEKLVLAELQKQQPELLPYCRGVALHDDTLVLFVTSGSWASRLRFVQSDILLAVNQSLGANIGHFKARVARSDLSDNAAPELGGRRLKKKNRPVMSEVSAEALMNAAMNETDPELAERLARLASRVNPPR